MCEYCKPRTKEYAWKTITFHKFFRGCKKVKVYLDDGYLYIYKNGEEEKFEINFCPECGRKMKGMTQFETV